MQIMIFFTQISGVKMRNYNCPHYEACLDELFESRQCKSCEYKNTHIRKPFNKLELAGFQKLSRAVIKKAITDLAAQVANGKYKKADHYSQTRFIELFRESEFFELFCHMAGFQPEYVKRVLNVENMKKANQERGETWKRFVRYQESQ